MKTCFGRIAPRQIAEKILRQKRREVRVQMLMDCPAEWQALVRAHVENGWRRK